MAGRSQPYRLKWPLTPTEVENIDDMLERLFKRVHALETTTVAPTSTVVITQGGSGPPGSDGVDGEDAMGTPGAPGATGATGATGPTGASGVAAPIVVGATTTVSTGTGSTIPESLEIQGGISLEIEGGGRIEVTGPVQSVYQAQLTLDAARVARMFSNPVMIAPAPGANKMIVPLLLLVRVSTTGYSNSRTLSARYGLTTAGAALGQNDIFGPTGNLVTTTASERWWFLNAPTINNFVDKNTPSSGGGSPINKPFLVFLNTGDCTTWTPGDYMKIEFVYAISDALS